MKNYNEKLTFNNKVVDGQRKGESNENGQETTTLNYRRVSDEYRETIRNFFTVDSLKNSYVDGNGDLFIVKLVDNVGPTASFYQLNKNYGYGLTYDPTPKIQRRDKQHSLSDRKQILLSYIGEEDLGNLLLVKKWYLEGGSHSQYFIIDGRQRSSIITEFLNDRITLTKSDASNFWKWFLNDEYLYSDILENEDVITSNKIIKSLMSGKTPEVKFSTLPKVIKNYIMDQYSLKTTVVTPEVWKLTKTSIEKVDESQWDMDKVKDAISRKFTDINRYVKPIANKDIIRTNTEDVVRKVWDMLEDKPTMAKEMGYTLTDIREKDGYLRFDDTNEVRKLQILITRALCIYQNKFTWGTSENILTKRLVGGESFEFTTITNSVWSFWKKMIANKIFDEQYYDGEDKKLTLPSEFVGGGSDILKIEFFLSTLYVCDIMLKNNYGAINGYFKGGTPTRKFYKLIEKLSIYLTLGKLANINHDEWGDEEKPLTKYDLGQEFYSTDKFNGMEIGILLNKVKDFNQHQSGLSKDYENTIRTLIMYSETKI